MTRLEEYAISELKKFVELATQDGICFRGCDINQNMQILVIQIVEDYIDEYEERNK